MKLIQEMLVTLSIIFLMLAGFYWLDSRPVKIQNFVDVENGCEYLATKYAITPRLNADGEQVGCKRQPPIRPDFPWYDPGKGLKRKVPS